VAELNEWGHSKRPILQAIRDRCPDCCVDEAAGVSDRVFEVAEGALASPNASLLMGGNPTRGTGYFANSHKHNRRDYTALHFRSSDSPLVAFAEALRHPAIGLSAEHLVVLNSAGERRLISEFWREFSERRASGCFEYALTKRPRPERPVLQ